MTNKTILTLTATVLISLGLFITWAISVTPTKEEAEAKAAAKREMIEFKKAYTEEKAARELAELKEKARLENMWATNVLMATKRNDVLKTKGEIDGTVDNRSFRQKVEDYKNIKEFRRELDALNKRDSERKTIYIQQRVTTTFQ